jgi:UDP-2,3-diacylglucosamine hydrolase
MKAVFLSDAHLTDSDPGLMEYVIRAVREVTRDADVVVILGDFFEFYHGFGNYIYPFFNDVVTALGEMAAKRPVYFIEGNHEFRMGAYFEACTGVKCVEKLAINIDGKKVFFSHGDEIGAPVLRTILKSRLILGLMDFLGPKLTWKIAMACRPLLSKSHKTYNEKTLNRFRRYGQRKLAEGYDAVVVAHSHMADMEERTSTGGTITYMNTGDLIGASSYGAYVTEKGFTLERYDPQCVDESL